MALKQRKPHKRTSDVWMYFTKSEDSTTGTCQLCNKTFKFSGNTTNFMEHLRNIHEKYPKRDKKPKRNQSYRDADDDVDELQATSTGLVKRKRPRKTKYTDEMDEIFSGAADSIAIGHADGHHMDRTIIPLPSGRSEVWKRKLFGFYSDDGKTIADRQKAVCCLCFAEIPYSGNTTNLGIHLAKRHSETYLSMKAELEAAGVGPGALRSPVKPGQRATIGSTVMVGHAGGGGYLPVTPMPRGAARSVNITDAVADFLAQDLHSASLAAGAGFHRLLTVLEPRYEPANVQATLDALQQRRQVISEALLERLSKMEACALTSDCWASDSGRNYFTLMARFVDADWCVQHYVLKTQEVTLDQTHANHIWDINKILADWGLMPRIVFHQSMEVGEGGLSTTVDMDGSDTIESEANGGLVVVAENPIITVEHSQMKVVAGLTNETTDMALALKHLGMPSLPCFAYLVNGAVCSGIGAAEAPSVYELIGRARRLVAHFSRNPKDKLLLRKRCQETGVPEAGEGGGLQLDLQHRWTTTADMIGVLLEAKGPLNAVLMTHRERGVRELGLSTEEWYQLEELYGALRAVAMAIGVLGGGDEYASCSMVMPMLARLKRKFMRIREHDTPAVFQFKKVVWDHLTPHYEGEVDTLTLFNVSTLLDPRFKDLTHLGEEQRAAVVQSLRQMVAEFEAAQHNDQLVVGVDESTGVPTPAKQSRRRMEELDLLFGAAEDEEGGDEHALCQSNVEVDKYLQEGVIDIKESPLDWWRRNWHRYPLLAKLARRHLCVPATAAPSECILEQESSVFYSRRRRLQPDEVDTMIFLNKNYGVSSS